MSNLFSNMKSEGLEESTDRLGGFTVYDSGIYKATIKNLYAGKSAGGAQNITLIADLEGGKEYRETVYITNKKGENFFTKDNKKQPLPGFTLANDICLMATGKELSEQTTEEKVVKIWNSEEKKELPTNVPVLVECLGKPISLGILRQRVNKEEKDSNGEYQPTAEEKEINLIDKVFHPDLKLTVAEARQGKTKLEDAAFYDSWEKRNKGVTQDRRKVKDGGGAAPGTPPKAGAAAGNQAPKKSLFSK